MKEIRHCDYIAIKKLIKAIEAIDDHDNGDNHFHEDELQKKNIESKLHENYK